VAQPHESCSGSLSCEPVSGELNQQRHGRPAKTTKPINPAKQQRRQKKQPAMVPPQPPRWRTGNDGGAAAARWSCLTWSHCADPVDVHPQANPQEMPPRVFGYHRLSRPAAGRSVEARARCAIGLVAEATGRRKIASVIRCPPLSAGAGGGDSPLSPLDARTGRTCASGGRRGAAFVAEC